MSCGLEFFSRTFFLKDHAYYVCSTLKVWENCNVLWDLLDYSLINAWCIHRANLSTIDINSAVVIQKAFLGHALLLKSTYYAVLSKSLLSKKSVM